MRWSYTLYTREEWNFRYLTPVLTSIDPSMSYILGNIISSSSPLPFMPLSGGDLNVALFHIIYW